VDYLGVPALDAGALFDTVVESIQSATLRRKLSRERAWVVAGSGSYTTAATTGTLDQLNAAQFTSPNVQPSEMVALYERLRVNAVPRIVYTGLVYRNAFTRCAYCSDRDATTLDHYLGKASFGVFAVLPANLVPACMPCNLARAARELRTRAPANTLHPHYDDVAEIRWLRARIVDAGGPVARLYADPAAVSTPYLRARSAEHLTALNLKRYFKLKAAQELAGLDETLPGTLLRRGISAVVDDLRTQAKQRAAGRTNCWERALFEALAEDDWYLTTHLPTLAAQGRDSQDPRRPIPLP
jgi:5-methylcytosine-specific restriction endonuclease McrA